MQLLIDAGNSRIKWALVNRAEWLLSGMLPIDRTAELPQECETQFANHGINLHDIRDVWVSNVAGDEVAQHIRKIGVVQTHYIKAQESQCGVRNGYSNKEQLGSDRWAALIAAWDLERGKCIVVSSGTATTIDTLSERGEFLGGLILPGLELMQRSLADATSKLKMSRGEFVQFPLNTADAMYSGAIQASCGAIERQQALLGDATIILSGGAADILHAHLGTATRRVDHLVMRGLLLIAQDTNSR